MVSKSYHMDGNAQNVTKWTTCGWIYQTELYCAGGNSLTELVGTTMLSSTSTVQVCDCTALLGIVEIRETPKLEFQKNPDTN